MLNENPIEQCLVYRFRIDCIWKVQEIKDTGVKIIFKDDRLIIDVPCYVCYKEIPIAYLVLGDNNAHTLHTINGIKPRLMRDISSSIRLFYKNRMDDRRSENVVRNYKSEKTPAKLQPSFAPSEACQQL